ncbi:MAG: hypothetical protein GX328_05565 [Clostridiaceae bacterium]|nr:hypothetical protein [Clostridiaceae bacterium]
MSEYNKILKSLLDKLQYETCVIIEKIVKGFAVYIQSEEVVVLDTYKAACKYAKQQVLKKYPLVKKIHIVSLNEII